MGCHRLLSHICGGNSPAGMMRVSLLCVCEVCLISSQANTGWAAESIAHCSVHSWETEPTLRDKWPSFRISLLKVNSLRQTTSEAPSAKTSYVILTLSWWLECLKLICLLFVGPSRGQFVSLKWQVWAKPASILHIIISAIDYFLSDLYSTSTWSIKNKTEVFTMRYGPKIELFRFNWSMQGELLEIWLRFFKEI